MRVDELKQKEQEEQELMAETRRVYQAFREGFLRRLREFADQAVEAGLEAAAPCREIALDGDILRIDFSLNRAELLLITPPDIYWLRDDAGDRLAGKMFLFRSQSSTAHPAVDIAVERLLNGRYLCEMIYFADDKPENIFREWLSEETSAEAGEHAANCLIEHFYSLKNSWVDNPTLGAFLGRQDGPRRMGFTTSS